MIGPHVHMGPIKMGGFTDSKLSGRSVVTPEHKKMSDALEPLFFGLKIVHFQFANGGKRFSAQNTREG